MHEDKFEKQVREKMDQLGFDPADAVWSGVSKEINKGKRRRLPLFWLFLFSGLILAGGGYYITRNVENVKNVGNVKRGEHKENLVRKDAKKSIALQRPGNLSGEIIIGHSKTDNKNFHRDIARINQNGTNDHERKLTQKTNGILERKSISASGSANINKTNSEDKIHPGDMVTDRKLSDLNKIPVNDQVTEKDLTNNNKIPFKDSVIERKSTNKTIIHESDSATDKKTDLNKKQKRWEIGVDGHAGISDIKQGSFVPVFSANNPGSVNASPGPPGPAAGSQHSEIHPGFSFGIGVFANRNLSRCFSLSGGIVYHYYSTHVQTGGTANSAAYSIYGPSALNGNYYLNGSGQSYTNNYHFLELPISINFQLNRSQKMPVILEAGLSFAYLLNSNALFFDPNTDLYVKNPQSFNKTQLNTTTALMFAFHTHQGEIKVGPQFQYGITGLTKEGNGASEHLFFYGMKISFIPRWK